MMTLIKSFTKFYKSYFQISSLSLSLFYNLKQLTSLFHILSNKFTHSPLNPSLNKFIVFIFLFNII